MRLPAVAIAAAFAAGAVLGQGTGWSQQVASRGGLATGLGFAALLIVAGILLTRRTHLAAAGALSLLAWTALGVAGAGIANQPKPPDHIVNLIEAGRVRLQTPLRWHGRLRDEPARLPWGYGYEIELTGVEYESVLQPVQGGLRISFSPPQEHATLPDVHAGDAVAALLQARQPQVFHDEGAFDRRAYLATQDVHLVGTLRAAQFLERTGTTSPSLPTYLARARARLRDEVDTLFAGQPRVAAVLRAMLLGDRSFVERDEATDFQKTGVFHVLVVAGLHVGAFAAFLFWAGRRLRLGPFWTAVLILALLAMYAGLVEERPPVLRAALMTAIVVLGGLFFRRLDLLNSAATAALVLLIAKPEAVRDASFQLTFLAIGCIAGLALPFLDKTAQPYVRALRGWRDVTRDGTHEPLVAQFRIDLRGVAHWVSSKAPARLATFTENTLAKGVGFSLRVWELVVLTMVLQIGMLPLMARVFHRITLDAPVVNLAAVPLTGIVVPLGFLALAAGFVAPAAGKFLAVPLGWLVLALLRVVGWFAGFAHGSYRIPEPPNWVIALFFAAALLLCVCGRVENLWRGWARRVGIVVLAASTLAIAVYPFAPQRSVGKLELTVLDVGQGDALLVVSPKGGTLLIDGGGAFQGFAGREEHTGTDPGEEAVSPYLWSRGFQKLDVVALTHAHQDHIGGLTAVLENFRVGALWIGRDVSSGALANLEKLAAARHIRIVHESRGKPFLWDGVEAQFLWPEAIAVDPASEPKNDDSLVLRMQYGSRSLLLPGDAEKQSERTMLAENSDAALRADVLKAGHHGSKNSTTPEFLAAVHPQVAVISAGENNPYGHPSPELLARLTAAGVRILRTDHDGAVHILTDGHGLEVRCFVDCSAAAAPSMHAQANLPQQK